ncbi:MAG: DUF3836 domain-containing protein [Tannerellaceae bacterium]|nr:DUF3836 domain-containing protein [Tannerellaceae bacterium]
MKMLARFRNTLILIAFMTMGIYAHSSLPANYIYETQEENGQVISKVVYKQDNNLLNKQFKYEFKYNPEGKVTEKQVSRWDKKKEIWQPFYLMTYTYNESEGMIYSTYGMWNDAEQAYNLNSQTINSSLSEYEEIFS